MCDETVWLRFAKVHRLYGGLAMRWGAKKDGSSAKFAFVGGRFTRFYHAPAESSFAAHYPFRTHVPLRL
jgi:hypothetical protein